MVLSSILSSLAADRGHFHGKRLGAVVRTVKISSARFVQVRSLGQAAGSGRARVGHYSNIGLPVLVVQGENDAIVRVTVAGQPYAIDDRRN